MGPFHMSSRHQGKLEGAATFLRASHISRWGIVHTTSRQNIAEHMYRVWVLVREWGPSIRLPINEQVLAEEWALIHDLPEIRTGDMPTPHKTPEVKAWLNQLESDIFPPLDEVHKMEDVTAAFCKFCDTAESILYLKINGTGQHAIDVRELLAEQMWDRLHKSPIDAVSQAALHGLFNDTYCNT